MLTYSLKCRKDANNIDAKFIETKNGKLVLLSKCAVCSCKKSRCIKEQEAKRLLSKLGIKETLSKIPKLNVLL